MHQPAGTIMSHPPLRTGEGSLPHKVWLIKIIGIWFSSIPREILDPKK